MLQLNGVLSVNKLWKSINFVIEYTPLLYFIKLFNLLAAFKLRCQIVIFEFEVK